jgi:hypothetical protein
MQFLDRTSRPVGTFRLSVFRAGQLVEEVVEPNLWVDAGSSNSASLYGGGGAGAITSIGFGTNATAPTLLDTALTGAFVQALGAATFPAMGLVTWPFGLAAASANGLAISEFGLLTTAGVLCARKNRATPIYKSAAIVLAGSWSIQF